MIPKRSARPPRIFSQNLGLKNLKKNGDCKRGLVQKGVQTHIQNFVKKIYKHTRGQYRAQICVSEKRCWSAKEGGADHHTTHPISNHEKPPEVSECRLRRSEGGDDAAHASGYY